MVAERRRFDSRTLPPDRRESLGKEEEERSEPGRAALVEADPVAVQAREDLVGP
jgi:hypothetical protein